MRTHACHALELLYDMQSGSLNMPMKMAALGTRKLVHMQKVVRALEILKHSRENGRGMIAYLFLLQQMDSWKNLKHVHEHGCPLDQELCFINAS